MKIQYLNNQLQVYVYVQSVRHQGSEFTVVKGDFTRKTTLKIQNKRFLSPEGGTMR